MFFTTFIQPKPMSIHFYSISQAMINKEKKHFSVAICVCCMMSCSEIFLSQDGIFQNSMCSNKKNFLLPPMVVTFGKHNSLISQFWENVISFYFLANTLAYVHHFHIFQAVHAYTYRFFWKGMCFNYLVSTL